MKAKTYNITIVPHQARLKVKKGGNLLRFLLKRGYSIPSACGGVGTCGKCRVLLSEGAKAPAESERVHLTEAELDAGWRLACIQHVDQDLVLEILEVEESVRAKELLSKVLRIPLDNGIKKACLELPKPSQADQRPDTVRLQEELGEGRLTFPLPVVKKVPNLLRQGDFKVTVTWTANHVLDLEPGDTTTARYGVAIDIGTTTLAGYLLDLNTGAELAVRSRMNPQRNFGDDVISRIKHVHKQGEEGLAELQKAVTSGINLILKHLCQAAKISPVHIYKATVAGNPTMIHLFTGLDPSNIDHSPFIPVLRDSLILPALELGLDMNPEGQVYILPGISGYVGADITAGILYTGLHQAGNIQLFIDIGTNAEIILGNKDRLLAYSTPAGPALEGARIKYGMNALPGAIAYVFLDDRDLKLETIGDGVPKGICGSGLIDLGGELCKIGLLNERGNLRTRAGLPISQRIYRGEKGQFQFLVSDGNKPIYLTQQDVRELQLVKGAIRSGVEIALQELGVTLKDVETVYLAGAFGNYVRRESVLRIGMLPEFPLNRIKPVGNTAGQGAKLCLLNRGKWEEIQRLTEQVEYFELSYLKDFSQVFIGSMHFPRHPHLE
jgi:uncharacterized 2Fe-2S/4Fe-4S cluster protein (DUF4445 family)